MKIYFITYGSGKFEKSSHRVAKEAKSLGLFDKTYVFSEKNLPLSIKSSPLFYSKRGGGYWLWKPFIINKVLDEIENGDIIVYSDAGNELFTSNKWNEYFNLLNKYSSIFFQYREDFDYGWSKYNAEYNDSPKIKYWTKMNTINHFRNLFASEEDWLEKNKIMAGLIFIKKDNNSRELIKEWLNNMLYFPQNVCDVMEWEKNNQIIGFSKHRHDQSILSILVRYFEKYKNILVLNEEFESLNKNQVVKTSRKIIPNKTVSAILRKIKKRFKSLIKDIFTS